MGESSHQLRR